MLTESPLVAAVLDVRAVARQIEAPACTLTAPRDMARPCPGDEVMRCAALGEAVALAHLVVTGPGYRAAGRTTEGDEVVGVGMFTRSAFSHLIHTHQYTAWGNEAVSRLRSA